VTRTRRLILAASAALAVALGACSSDAPKAVRGDVPKAMAAVGDSMTRGFNVGSCCVFSDAPEYSWASGDNPAVGSHYQRLRRLNPDLRAFNFAKSGAKMDDLERQVRAAGDQPVGYLTVMIGANDVLLVLRKTEQGCVARPDAMTPVATFRAQFEGALRAFTAARPQASILVASIPDVPRLWLLFRQDPTVLSVWDRLGSCEQLLRDRRTDVAIRAASDRLKAYNATLAEVCATFARCRWDGGVVYRYPFTKGDFSEVDYFHPNRAGQRRIAQLTWRASSWS
jgi:lysophospholipase L1-like esterase